MSDLFILGTKWELSVSESIADFGECNPDERKIVLKQNQSTEQKADTLIHEINHAIWEMMDISDKDREETTVKRLSTGLTSVLRDERNEQVRKMIFEGVRQ
jgi:uncharacterized protein YpmB